MRRVLSYGGISAYLLFAAPNVSYAHSFGTPYVLPVPFWMYVYGCAATLIVTFAVHGYFAGAPVASTGTRTRKVGTDAITRTVGRWVLWLLRLGAIGCLLLTIGAALFGDTDPAHNIGMTLFWVIFLLGFSYFTLFMGDLYALINPWRLTIDGLEHLGLDLSTSRVRYPRCLDHWPAFLVYVALIYIELFIAPKPLFLSTMLLAYSAITFVGVALFGKEIWFSKADFFSVFFRLIGKLAPVEYTPANNGTATWQVQLRWPFVGALNDKPKHISLVLFVLFMLSSTTYDSIHNTVLWTGLFWRNLLWLLQPVWGTDLGAAQSLLMDWYIIYRQAGLLLFPFIYFLLLLIVLWWAKTLAVADVPLRTLVMDICYSLLPIAVAYHFTHYFALLIVELQRFPSLVCETLGFKCAALGNTGTFESRPLPMGVVWHTQVAVLLIGHVASVFLAHSKAARTFSTHRKIVSSQLPLLFLMIVYTAIGLWILSLPLEP